MLPIKFEKSEKGASLYFAMVILSILLAIALGLSAILIGQTRMITGMGDSVVAFYAADTGIERVLYEDKLCRQAGCFSLGWSCVDIVDCDKGRSSSGSPLSGTVAGASYQASFNDGATSIISRGLYKGTRRAMQVDR